MPAPDDETHDVTGGSASRHLVAQARLKNGKQRLALTLGRDADIAWESVTPGKAPLAQRSELGCVLLADQRADYAALQPAPEAVSAEQEHWLHEVMHARQGCNTMHVTCRRLEQLVKRYERGEMRRVEWLDGMSMRAVDRLRDEVPHTLSAACK